MCTLMDSAWSDIPQRRTIFVGRELGRYGIEIAALSDTHFAEIWGDQRKWRWLFILLEWT